MGLKICSLASGSKGNCCFVSDGTTNILIDLGISASRVEKALKALGTAADGISVLVTHAHSDHVGGIKVFSKKHPTARIICQQECMRAVSASSGCVPAVAPSRAFKLGTLYVKAVPVSHDVPCFGYIISDGKKKVAVVTDIGRVSTEQLDILSGCDVVMLEANHDLQKLAENPRYTELLKARIRSDRGHLSNDDCAAACAYLAAAGVKWFILAHLSEENNDPTLAAQLVESSIKDTGVTDVRVTVATQNAMTGLLEVC